MRKMFFRCVAKNKHGEAAAEFNLNVNKSAKTEKLDQAELKKYIYLFLEHK